MIFVRRQLDQLPQTLGEKLRALRRGQAVSLEMMERDTQIRRSYLQALERGEYEKLPEPLYARNFIRSYARVLGADEDYFLELYEEECGLCDLIIPMQTPRQKMNRGRLRIWNSFIKFGLLSLILIFAFGYLGWQVRSIVAPPEIVIVSPANESLTADATITIEGFVDNDATVYVNGKQVVVNTDSTFITQIDLQKGLNEILIEAERRYSRRAIIKRNVVFSPESGISHVSFLY